MIIQGDFLLAISRPAPMVTVDPSRRFAGGAPRRLHSVARNALDKVSGVR